MLIEGSQKRKMDGLKQRQGIYEVLVLISN
jgi:hypothetical protein